MTVEHREYEHVVRNIVRGRPYDKPLLTGDVVRLFVKRRPEIPVERARKIVYWALGRLVRDDVVRRCARGVYIRTKRYRLGDLIDKTVGMTRTEAMSRLLTRSKSRIIGYETVPSLMNRIGLSTMMTRRIDIATNKYRRIIPERVNVIVHKPPLTVTPGNVRYLQVISIIKGLEICHVDAETPQKIVRNIIKRLGLDTEALKTLYEKIHGDGWKRVFPEL